MSTVDFQIEINDGLVPGVQQAMAMARNTAPLMAACGRHVVRLYQDHFRKRDAEPNKMGWPKQHKWSDIAKSTALDAYDAEHAVVVVSDPALNLKIHGGDIRPKRGRTLAIPQIAEAYAAGSPREGSGDRLSVVVRYIDGKPTGIALAENQASEIRLQKTKRGIRVIQTGSAIGVTWYRLVPKVTVGKDPRAIPTPLEVLSVVRQAVREWMAAVTNQPGLAGRAA